MRKVTLNASVYVRLQKKWQTLKKVVRYQWSEVKPARFPSMEEHPSGNKTVFIGRFPDRVMVGLLHSDAVNGDLGRNPSAFEKFGVTQVRQSLSGEEYPYRTLALTGDQDYEDLLGYHRFLMAIGSYNEHKIPMLLPIDWG